MKVHSDGPRTKMLTFIQLQEKRKNSTINKKQDGFEELIAFLKTRKDIDELFVTMTMLPKVGINPQSTYDTPIGIYSYPASYVMSRQQFRQYDFQGDAPYFNVIRANDMTRVIDLQDMSNEIYWTLLKKLKTKYSSYSINELEKNAHLGAKVKRNGGFFWYITMELSKRIAEEKGGKSVVQWNTIMRSLDLMGCIDTATHAEDAIIHENEPTQAVFFNGQFVTVLARIKNISPKWEMKDVYKEYMFISNLIKEKKYKEAQDHYEQKKLSAYFEIFRLSDSIHTLETLLPNSTLLDSQYSSINLLMSSKRFPRNWRSAKIPNDLYLVNAKTLINMPNEIDGNLSIKDYAGTDLNGFPEKLFKNCTITSKTLKTLDGIHGNVFVVNIAASNLENLNAKNLTCFEFILRRAKKLKTLEGFPNVKNLISVEHSGIVSLKGISTSKTIYLKNLPNLVSLVGLDEGVTILKLNSCDKLTSFVGIPKSVKFLEVSDCDNLTSWEGLENSDLKLTARYSVLDTRTKPKGVKMS